MTRKKTLAIYITTAAVVSGTTVPALAGNGRVVAVDEVVPQFTSKQTTEDVLPAAVDLTELGNIRSNTTRSLGAVGEYEYWVGRNAEEDVCLIASAPGEHHLMASSCLTIPQFYRSGLSLEAVDASYGSVPQQAYLLPHDVAASRLSGTSDHVLGQRTDSPSNLLVVASPLEQSPLQMQTISRESGIDFMFAPLRSERDS